jgi:hypothetical protein
MTKASKRAARYRDGTADKQCALCTMFRPPHRCTAVAGDISPQKLCDFFKRAPAPLAAGRSVNG